MQIYIRIFVLLNLLNSFVILVAPELWYELTPGASSTGPYNVHFIRDIGISFMAASSGLWLGISHSRLSALSGPIAGIIFIFGHALLHLIEMTLLQLPLQQILSDFALIVLPASAAAYWLIAEIRRTYSAEVNTRAFYNE